jgi:hypothetical protein
VTGAVEIALYAWRESLRRRVFFVVIVLSLAFLALYAVGTTAAFNEVNKFGSNPNDTDPSVVAGSTLLGLAMFATLFLGTVLAVFLTLSAVRGDAERGLLQPLVVRPLGRPSLLAGRFVGAAAVCAVYVGLLYAISLVITLLAGDWTPDHMIAPGLELMAAVVVLAGVSLLGSVFLPTTANGIAVFMGVRRRARGGVAGADRRRDPLADAPEHRQRRRDRAAVRGALPGGAPRAHVGHERARELRGEARPVRRRAPLRTGPRRLGLRIPRAARRGGRVGLPPQRPLTGLFRTIL